MINSKIVVSKKSVPAQKTKVLKRNIKTYKMLIGITVSCLDYYLVFQPFTRCVLWWKSDHAFATTENCHTVGLQQWFLLVNVRNWHQRSAFSWWKTRLDAGDLWPSALSRYWYIWGNTEKYKNLFDLQKRRGDWMKLPSCTHRMTDFIFLVSVTVLGNPGGTG